MPNENPPESKPSQVVSNFTVSHVLALLGFMVISSATGYAAHAQLQPPPPVMNFGTSQVNFDSSDRIKMESILVYCKAIYRSLHVEVDRGDSLRLPTQTISY